VAGLVLISIIVAFVVGVVLFFFLGYKTSSTRKPQSFNSSDELPMGLNKIFWNIQRRKYQAGSKKGCGEPSQ